MLRRVVIALTQSQGDCGRTEHSSPSAAFTQCSHKTGQPKEIGELPQRKPSDCSPDAQPQPPADPSEPQRGAGWEPCWGSCSDDPQVYPQSIPAAVSSPSPWGCKGAASLQQPPAAKLCLNACFWPPAAPRPRQVFCFLQPSGIKQLVIHPKTGSFVHHSPITGQMTLSCAQGAQFGCPVCTLPMAPPLPAPPQGNADGLCSAHPPESTPANPLTSIPQASDLMARI